MARVDLHILTYAATNPDWLQQAVASVAGHPVNLLIHDHPGTIAEGRITAVLKGTAEFVAWLDSDDVLFPGAVQACIAALDANPAAVAAYTDCVLIDDTGVVLRDGANEPGPWQVQHMPWWGGYAEHLCVMRRAAVMSHLEATRDYPQGNCHLLRGLIAQDGDFIHVPQAGYGYRQHGNNSSHRADTALLMAAYARIYAALRQSGRIPTHRVDVHVLYCHEPKHWLEAALRSLENEPVNVHLCPGIAGKVGLARARAFACGNAPFVAFVDGDDEVMPGAFDAALAVLDSRPEVVSTYCDIQLIDQPEGTGYIKAPWNPAAQLQRIAEVHHLHVIRRSAVMPLLDELARWDGYEEYVLMGLLCRYGVHHHIPRQLYRFRQHNRYHRAGMIGGQAMRRAATKTVTPVLAPLIAAGVCQRDAG